jgi:hypothetical protein
VLFGIRDRFLDHGGQPSSNMSGRFLFIWQRKARIRSVTQELLYGT